MRVPALLCVLTLIPLTAFAAPDLTAEQARPRVEHHLQEIDRLTQHFDTVIQNPCPRFATTKEWEDYFNGEVEQVVLFWAHVEQAWVEAKRTGDDDVRREAKAPRKKTHQARALMDKLESCAADNGASFSPFAVWRRIEREVPERQTQIALP